LQFNVKLKSVSIILNRYLTTSRSYRQSNMWQPNATTVSLYYTPS